MKENKCMAVFQLCFVLVCVLSAHGASATNQSKYAQLENKIAVQEYKKITSVLVQHNGKLKYEKYFNNGSRELLNNVRSTSKSFTAMLFGIAMKEGYFKSPKDKVIHWFKDKAPFMYPFKAKEEMNFDQLLSMTSPLECDDGSQFSEGNEERMYLRKDWEAFALNLPERGTPAWEVQPKDQPYGRDHDYCTAGVFLIGAAIERATQKGLDVFADEKLFKPMGISKVKWQKSPLGIIQGGGGLDMRSIDLLKIGQLMLDKGRYGRKQLIPAQWVDAMFEPRAMAVEERNIEYGYLWWINHFEIDGKEIKAFAAAGNGGNYLFVVPSLNLVSVITSQAYNTSYMHQQSQQIFSDYVLTQYASSVD